MFFLQIGVNLSLFFVSTLYIFLNRRNILMILMAIELILLSLNLNFICFSLYLDDLYGQIFSFFILTIAASESAVGLAIIIVYYRIRGSIASSQKQISSQRY